MGIDRDADRQKPPAQGQGLEAHFPGLAGADGDHLSRLNPAELQPGEQGGGRGRLGERDEVLAHEVPGASMDGNKLGRQTSPGEIALQVEVIEVRHDPCAVL